MKKKKILLFSDDMRMSSGVGTMSREIIMGTAHHFDWVQVGGAIKHPEQGQMFDLSEDVNKGLGIDNASVKVFPVSGYGNPDILRQMINMEQPDAIMIYTDPRFWIWLFHMEHEIRQNIPIFYYNIWDDWPAPQYNENYYESCDLIMNISKQTCAIVDEVSKRKPRTDWDSTYVPHGINTKSFYPIPPLHEEYEEMIELKKKIFSIQNPDDIEFVLFYNNRNIRRKMTSDALLAFQEFRNRIPEEKRDKVAFLLHTQPRDENGTDLPEVVKQCCPDYDVIFSDKKLDDTQLSYLYNMADVTINMASNEGFGLGTCEALMCGTPISVNVTGGLQDQCGFRYKGELLTYKDYSWVHSLHDEKKWKDNSDLTWGEWAKPVWPSNRSLQGSIPTPYIFDDRPRYEDFADALKEWYDMGKEERDRCGMLGHEFVMGDDAMMSAKAMCQNFIDHMETAFEKWEPRKRYTIFEG